MSPAIAGGPPPPQTPAPVRVSAGLPLSPHPPHLGRQEAPPPPPPGPGGWGTMRRWGRLAGRRDTARAGRAGEASGPTPRPSRNARASPRVPRGPGLLGPRCHRRQGPPHSLEVPGFTDTVGRTCLLPLINVTCIYVCKYVQSHRSPQTLSRFTSPTSSLKRHLSLWGPAPRPDGPKSEIWVRGGVPRPRSKFVGKRGVRWMVRPPTCVRRERVDVTLCRQRVFEL